jgi:hypothetical protein
MSGQRPPWRSRDSGHPGASFFTQEDKFDRFVDWSERRYLILTNQGDEYLVRIEVAKWEASKLNFEWTKDRDKAKGVYRRGNFEGFYPRCPGVLGTEIGARFLTPDRALPGSRGG